MTSSLEFDASEDESRGAVFMVQPDEIPQCKALRRLVDSVFLATDQFLFSSITYLDMGEGGDGVNRHLRSMLFQPPKRLRRGARRSDVLGSSRDPRSDGNSVSAAKQTQRQSKQKERCENKLMSLLFATIYDPATKQCRLVHDVPPLKLRRRDNNGSYRNVSNYTDVRLYLRNSMAAIISGHTEGVKKIVSLLPPPFTILPMLFVLIGRTFFLALTQECCIVGRSNSGKGKTSRSEHRSERAGKVVKLLEACIENIEAFITTWERRNFTTDNALPSSLKAGTKNECYNAIVKLLVAMIAVKTPIGNEPFNPCARENAIYEYGLSFNSKCSSNRGVGCCLGKKCPRVSKRSVNFSEVVACVEFIDALRACASMTTKVDISLLDEALDDPDFHPAVWNNNFACSYLHRFESISETVRSKVDDRQVHYDDLVFWFVQQVQTDVARCWSAFGRSNSCSASILGSLGISDVDELRETVVELVFGGGIAATALFEREKPVIPICAKLRSKKGPQVVMMNEETSEDENIAGVRFHDHGIESGNHHDVDQERGEHTVDAGNSQTQCCESDIGTEAAQRDAPHRVSPRLIKITKARNSPPLQRLPENVRKNRFQSTMKPSGNKRTRRGGAVSTREGEKRSDVTPRRKSRRRL